MFSTVEKFSGPAKILLGLIALTFVGFGASSVAHTGSDYIVKIGDEKITEHDVNRALQNAQAEGDSNVTRASVLQALRERAYLLSGAKALGLEASVDKLKQQIVSIPMFQENGQFVQAKFNDYLKQAGISEDEFVNEQRDAILLDNLINLGRDGIIISDAQAKQLLNLTQSVRTVRSISYNPQAFVGQVKTSDESLQAYYNEHKTDYATPEAIKFQYVVLSVQDLASKQTVSEAEVKEAFEKSGNDKQARREVQHILIPLGNTDTEKAANKALAEKVMAEARANPAKFGDLAKQYSKDEATAGQGGNLGLIQKGSGFNKPFEDTVFTMNKGQISDVLTSDYGYQIIKLNDIKEASLEQDRAAIEAELKQRKAQQAFNKAKEELAAAAFENSSSLEPVAKKLGLKIETINQWISKQEAEQEVAKNQMSADFVKALFSDDVLKKKHNSEPVSVSENAVAVVRVNEVRAASQQTFEQAKEQVKLAYIRAEATRMAQDKAKQDLVDLQTGEKVNLAWTAPEKLTPAQAGQALPPQAYQTLLKAHPSKDKPAYFLAEGLPVPVLIAVDDIQAPENVDAMLPQAKQSLLQNDANMIFQNLMAYFQALIPVKEGSEKVNEGA